MGKIRIYPYKQGSKSAKVLAEALGGKVLKHVGSKYKPRVGDLVINWGAGNFPNFAPATALNTDVKVAANKLKTFEALKENDVRVPDFWTDKDDIPADAYPVVCRTVLAGHSGAGIVIAHNPEELVAAPLYTCYVKKKDEYRVHMVNGEAVFVQRKAKKNDVENPNWQVRNLAGGFVFVACELEDVPDDVHEQACRAVRRLNLDIGGVDVIWNERDQKAYVLEINTACGLEERTAEKYAEALRAFYG